MAVDGSLKKIEAALEAAGVRGNAAKSIIAGARGDHSMFGAETEAIAKSRAGDYIKELRSKGFSLGPDAVMTIECELQRYFMTPHENIPLREETMTGAD